MTTGSHPVLPHRAATAGPNPTPGSLPVSPADGRFTWLAPMVLWPLARRHIPRPALRRQGGGTQRADDEAMFAAILYVLVSGVPWRALPKTFAVSWQNTHRRFTQWSALGLWDRIQYASLDPRTPPTVRQWADRMRSLADARAGRPTGNDGGAAAYGPEFDAQAARTTPAAELRPRPRIRVHEPDGFTDRLFGAGALARGTSRSIGEERGTT